VEVILGLVRPLRAPSNLCRRCDEQQDREEQRDKRDNRCILIDRMLDTSIGHDSIIYIGGGLILVGKYCKMCWVKFQFQNRF
jgi:hypothetical protein